MLKTMLWGLSKLDTNWLSYEQNTICPYMGIRTKVFKKIWRPNSEVCARKLWKLAANFFERPKSKIRLPQ